MAAHLRPVFLTSFAVEDDKESPGLGLLTWAGGVGTDWLAGDRLTAHLSQLKKQKDTREETQSIPTTSSRTLQGPLFNSVTHRKVLLGRGPNTWALVWMTGNASQKTPSPELPKRDGWTETRALGQFMKHEAERWAD